MKKLAHAYIPDARKQLGSGLIESLMSIAILSFGILGLARFQINMLVQSNDAQSRMTATALAEELLAMVRVDVTNAACYTSPAQGPCASTFAAAQAQAWTQRASTAMPGVTSVVASMPDSSKFSISLTWSSKAFRDQRTFQVITDVRP